jgi:hypothetical protein
MLGLTKGQRMAVAPEDGRTVPKRDALGQACFFLHVVIMIYIIAGWMLPARAALIFYLVFVPAVALHWQFNKNACVLNNIESLIRTGRWRNPANHEEGAWLLSLVKDWTGLCVTQRQMDAISYAAMALLWTLAMWHFRGW